MKKANKTMTTTGQYIQFDRAYQYYNEKLFFNGLPESIITIKRDKRAYGYFIGGGYKSKGTGGAIDEICLNPDYFPLSDKRILSTLVHEMTHCWQHHFGKPSIGWHNKEWAGKMEKIGLMPSSTGLPGGGRIGHAVSHYIIAGGDFDLVSDELLKDKKVIEIESAASQCTKTKLVRKRKPGEPLILKSLANVGRYTRLMVNDQFFTITGINIETGEVTADPLSGDFEIPAGTDIYVFNRPPEKTARNKVKYTCPGCGLNMWGKPGVKVQCVECELVLIEN